MLIFDIEDSSCLIDVSRRLHQAGVADWAIVVLNLNEPKLYPSSDYKNMYILLDSDVISAHTDYSDDFVLDLIESGYPVLDKRVNSTRGSNEFLADCETFGLKLVKPIWSLSFLDFDERVAATLNMLLTNAVYEHSYFGMHNCYLRVTVDINLNLVKAGKVLGSLKEIKDILSVICSNCVYIEDTGYADTFLSSYTVSVIDYLFDADVIATGELIRDFKMRLVEAVQDITADVSTLHQDYMGQLWQRGYIPLSHLFKHVGE